MEARAGWPPSAMRSASPVLAFGTFYGNVNVRRCAPGLDVAVLDVDPHRIVERHSHEEAHFVLVLDGLYVSSASGADAISRGPFLVFNPAGTTHRDRFEARSRVMEGPISYAIGVDPTKRRPTSSPDQGAPNSAHQNSPAIDKSTASRSHERCSDACWSHQSP